ncbi:chorismate-binding protein [Streptomyces sp. NPDC048420]|uniref:chorismate-binding protein n=1 Tax=Streptomyces sp. NPDC048420 TaxID=3155755 RepID=UPI00342E766F
MAKALAGPTGPVGDGPDDVEGLLGSGEGTYRHAVTRTVADIRAGLLQKAVLSRPLPLPAHTAHDLPATYLAGRRANTPARSFLLDLGGWRTAGFSPETVVEVEGGYPPRLHPAARRYPRPRLPPRGDRAAPRRPARRPQGDP